MTPADLDALVARLQGFNPPDRTIASQRDYSQAIHDAAAALVQLREENARLTEAYGLNPTDPMATACSAALKRAERAEAEVARLTKQASAVVVIMPPREPTQEMDDAASNVDRSNLPGIFRRQVWRAMWDASGVAKDSVITGNEP